MRTEVCVRALRTRKYGTHALFMEQEDKLGRFGRKPHFIEPLHMNRNACCTSPSCTASQQSCRDTKRNPVTIKNSRSKRIGVYGSQSEVRFCSGFA